MLWHPLSFCYIWFCLPRLIEQTIRKNMSLFVFCFFLLHYLQVSELWPLEICVRGEKLMMKEKL